jgi:hypothetical protein
MRPGYAQLQDRFPFGSEIKALLADGLRRTADVESLSPIFAHTDRESE